MHLIQPDQDKKPFLLLALTVLVTLSALALLSLRLAQYSRLEEGILQRSLEVRELRSEIIYLDEALTMSARMAVFTGKMEWQQRYREFEPRLDAVLAKAAMLTKELLGTAEAAAQTNAANARLTEMEHRAFDLQALGQQEAARHILFSEEYAAQRALYAEGMSRLDGQLDKVAQDARQSGDQYLKTAIASILVALPLLAALWFYVLKSLRSWKAHLVEANRQIRQQNAELAARTDALRHEVAERQRAEAAVSHYFDVSLDLLCIAGFDGHFKRLNPAWQKTLGWSAEELCAQPFLSFVHPDDQAATLEATQTLSRGENIIGFENRYRSKDGSWRWLLWQATSSPAEGLIHAVAHDFTERHLREAARQHMVEHALELDQALLELRGQAAERLDTFLPAVTEQCARSLNVARVSVWLLDETGQELQCRDLYEPGPRTHSSGERRSAARYPHFFQVLTSRTTVVVDDILHDPATRELAEDYLVPLGIASLLDVPLMAGGKLSGALFCQHVGPPRQWTVQEQKFAAAVAAHVMLAIEAAQRHRALETLRQREEMLAGIRALHEEFLAESEGTIQHAFESLLGLLLRATQSEYGFAGEVCHTAEGLSYLKTLALSNIAWDDDTRRLYDEQASQGLEFHNLRTLFGAVITSGEAVIANAPATDPRRGGLPAGHPPLQAFLGLPIKQGTQLLGMIGVANRTGGYSEADIAELQPLLATSASLILANRSEQQRLAAEAELHQLNDTLELRVEERTAELNSANETLRQSEKKYHDLAESLNEVIYRADPKTLLTTYVNRAVERLYGYTVEEWLGNPALWEQTIHPEDRERVFRAFAEAQTKMENGAFEYRITSRDSTLHWVVDHFIWEKDPAGHIVSLNGVMSDITQRKQSELALQRSLRAQRTQSVCNSILVHATEEQQLLDDMCRNIIEQGGYRLAWIGIVEHDAAKSVRPVASAGYEAGYLESIRITWADSERGQGPTGRAVRLGTPQFAADILTDPQYALWREQALKRGYASSIALPLKDGEVFGVLNIYAAEPAAFDEDEIRLLQELADDLAYGILALRTHQERDHYQAAHLKSAGQLKESLIGTIRAIALTVEKRDPYTAGHQGRVANLAVAIAQELGLDAERIEGLRLGAMIHDIGKIYVPAEILNRPGRLTENEFGMIKSHAEVGYDIIKDVKFPWPVADMVLQHHERTDGSGYPRGLKGGEIILEARILGVADVVEAITSHRPYRPAIGIEAGLYEIEAGRGQAYDADVVDACLRLFREKGYRLGESREADHAE